ncbi:MAG: 2-hydroxychromene-2-carboxylate isomerase [Alphaproteobacteria bacterium 32-64-14]|nr:MAG: 2-hydroxychromene-2-carboxylate isomerase [Alphaproteobacteria bacterium 32-64-14]
MNLQFWFEFASTYSYPAVMRIDKAAAARGVSIEWRPFLLGPLFHAQQGLKDSPFNAVPVKGSYMWRDMERICERYSLPFRRPGRFPQNGLMAARITHSLGQEDRPNFVKAVYQANFVHDRDISDPQILHAAARRAGLDPLETLAAMTSEPVKQQLKDETAKAADLGIFGAPSFLTEDGELFWGNDRLEDALDWAVRGTLRPNSQN